MPVRGMSRQLTRAEGQVRQDRQFLGNVAAVDVHDRIGLGVAELLGLGHGGRIVGPQLLHLRQNEIARAVENGVDRLNLVGRERLADGGDDRDAAGHGPLEGDGTAQLPRPGKQFRAVLGQQGLVGRNHVLAAFEQLQHDGPVRLHAADDLHHGRNLRVVQHLGEVGGEQSGGERDVARPGQVRIDHLHQLQPLAGVLGDPLATLQQQSRHPRADGPESDNRNFGGFHGVQAPIGWQKAKS